MDTGSMIAFALVGSLAMGGLGVTYSKAEKTLSVETEVEEFLNLVDDKSPRRDLKAEELSMVMMRPKA
ncbi:hypothetical protein [Sulfitobacter sp. R18_1]|uniref:hypothetical protein n=1 Tax=Sulfitobacter sp. R18_1 TaxID=2821104 RepID=UPI001ADA3175|nr:hypothetical protein [Sulfitobacter sp. R18_1]MBO9428258.1 hypothetical protein [Sulfitobacter sp. R18_1]